MPIPEIRMNAIPTVSCAACGGDIRAGAAYCPQCGKRRPPAAPAPLPTEGKDKKIAVGKPRWVFIVAALGVAFAGYLFIENLPGGDHPVIALQPGLEVEPAAAGEHADQVPVTATVEGDRITIPVGDVRAKRIVEFEYSDGTVTVPLLAFITGEGKLVTAYRMCEPCNSKKFSIDGDRLSCGNCETQWSLNTLEGLQGTCQKYAPEPFPSRIEGDLVVMSVAQVKKWQIRL